MLPEMTLVEASETTPRHDGVGLTSGAYRSGDDFDDVEEHGG